MSTRELIVDLFAGGGGASTGIEQATGLWVDIAVNHDPEAVAMHLANHPGTRHLIEDVFKVNPMEATAGRPVGLLWASPDCTHHSRAKGGKPVSKKIRGLAWVVVKWAKAVRPRVITLENVPEFREWGPTMKVKIRDKKTGRFKTVEKPDPKKKGMTFQLWSNQLRGLGYEVQFRELSAADYGAPTIRKRLFMIARCDGKPIVWPEPTHAAESSLFGLKPYRTAAECIDWTIPCPSIFGRKKPLAAATLRRIARGIEKFVINTGNPFIVTCNHSGDHFRGCDLNEPMKTITAARDAHGLVTPVLVGIDHQSSQSAQWKADQPLRTITRENRFAVVAPFLTKYHGDRGGQSDGRGQVMDAPLRVQDTQNRFGLVSAFLTKFYGTTVGSDLRQPMPTVTGQGQHIGEVRAFLVKYFGQGVGQPLSEPLHTIKGKAHLGLVTVAGQDYQIADIGLRMLQPRELARAQGFADTYRLLGTKSSQVAKIGNSVCPPVARALVAANVKIEEVSKSRVG